MLTILNYHAIDNLGMITSVRPERFAAQMRFLVEHRYRVLPLDEVLSLLKSRAPIPPRCTAITFDDGYQSVYTCAFESLRSYSFPATIFVTSGMCGKWSNWPEPHPRPSSRPMLSPSEICELASNGFSIGAHTVSHHRLTRLGPEEARREIEESQIQLEQMIGKPVRHFAYPHGESNPAIRAYAASRFDSAYGVDFRLATHEDDIYNLPRLDTFYLDDLLRLGGPDKPAAQIYVRGRRVLRGFRLKLMGANDSPD